MSKACAAIHVQDIEGALPGAFELYTKHVGGELVVAGMVYNCPCGCGHAGALAFRPHQDRDDRASWQWNGDREKPTLHPSVHHVGHFHGWLKDGVWTEC